MKQMAKGRMLRQNKEAYLNCMREKDIHKGLIHPNIIRMVEIIEDENDEDKLYLVMEFAENGQISVYDERSKKFWPPRTVGQSLSETEIL
jgi:serine/threonine protein kinase